jgi:hypothetical protein
MTHNRSSEELAMRDMLVAWGRKRWPDARVFHELTIETCRIDLAFITPTNLIGIEIKSSKDTLDRLDKQIEVFCDHLPVVYVAHHQKWTDKIAHGSRLEVFLNDDGPVKSGVYEHGWKPDRINWRVYTRLLDILWADELRAIGNRHLFGFTKKSTMGHMLPVLAAKLTGEQILHEACHELRGRPTFNLASDAQICERAAAVPAKAMQLL